jgi:phage shock protein A
MNLFQRISRLLAANINHMLDKAEDPEVIIKQIVREMEEGVAELRRETVRAVALRKQLEKKVHASEQRAHDLEEKARAALSEGDEQMAREFVRKRLTARKECDVLAVECATASEAAERFRNDLSDMEKKLGEALRRKEDLIRRSQSARARLRGEEAAARSAVSMGSLDSAIDALESGEGAFESLEAMILRHESEAEAVRELRPEDNRQEVEFQQSMEDRAVEKELQRLREQERK